MEKSTKKKFYKRKRLLIPLLLIIGLIVFRFFLPTIVKNYVNKVLADIPDYYGQVEDIDIALFRGAYVINGMYLNKVDKKTQVPFLNFPQTDISVEWKSLFKGEIVSEVYMTSPEIIYVKEDMESSTSTTEEDWTKALTDIIPLDINHFNITDGKLAFVEASADPTIDLQISQIELTASNLRNVVAKDRTLPSSIVAEGVSIGNGKMTLEGDVNIIREVPDMDIALSLESVDVTALNDFSRHYASIDSEKGNVDLFTEMAIADGFLKGYFKVLLNDSKFVGKEDGFLETLWEGFAGFFRFILKNQRTDTLAVKAPLEGDLNNLQTGVWQAVASIFRNAFVEAFNKGVDEEIEYQDAFIDEDNKESVEEDDGAKWWEFRKKRKERKERERKEGQAEKKSNSSQEEKNN